MIFSNGLRKTIKNGIFCLVQLILLATSKLQTNQ
jgi:hypothetical protein